MAKSIFFRPKVIAAVVASTLASMAAANPVGGTVIAGTATMQQVGNILQITAADKTIINWQGFSIGKDEVTQFLQPSSSSSVLNRVVGQDPSVILGRLQSNGNVFLINPNGIVFGQGAQVNVGGLVASTLDIKNNDFLAGNYVFAGNSDAKISNAAFIETTTGGRVAILAKSIENSGVIRAQDGQIWLAAGAQVTLADSNSPGMYVTVQAPTGQAVNLGQMIAERGVIGMIGNTLQNSGTISATGIQSAGGHIMLVAQGPSSSIQTTASSVITADGDTQGGMVTVKADDVALISGSISANGGKGFIETSAGYLDVNSAKIEAKDGIWLIDPYNIEIVSGVVGNNSTNTGTNPINFTATGTTSQIGAGTINTILNGGTSVVVDTTSAIGTDVGNITISSAITKTAGGNATLTLQADNSIFVNAGISSSTGNLNVSMLANQATPGSGSGGVSLAAPINTNGGTLSISNANSVSITGAVTAAGGANIASRTGTTINNGGSLNSGAAGAFFTGGVTESGTSSGYISAGAVSVSASGQAVDLSGSNNFASLAVNAAGAGQSIIVNTTGAMDIGTVNGVSGINANGGDVSLTTAGNLTQSAALSNVNSLALNTANATLTNSANNVVALGNITAAALNLVNSHSGLSLNGALSAAAANITTSGNLVLGTGASLSLSGTGNALTLGTTGNFQNSSTLGASAISMTGGGYWLIYSNDHTAAVTGGLSGNGLYNCTMSGCTSSTIATMGLTGNRFVFQTRPTLTVTPTSGQSRVYDGQGTAGDGTLTYGLSGYLFGDVNDDAMSGSLARAAGANVGTYSFSASGLASKLGYQIAMTGSPATYAITPKALTYASANSAMTYGDPIALGSYTLSGVVAGDVGQVSATQGLKQGATNYATTGVLHVGTYQEVATGLSGSAASNYSLASTGNTVGNLTINQRSITVTADAQSKILGAADPALTYHVSNGSMLLGDGFSGGLSRTPGEALGNYAINQGSLATSSDYAMSYVGANFNIHSAPVVTTPVLSAQGTTNLANAVLASYQPVVVSNPSGQSQTTELTPIPQEKGNTSCH